MTSAETHGTNPTLAVLLAAGEGSRLFAHTRVVKPLAPLMGLSLAERTVCTFGKDLGVRRFVVVVGFDAETVEAHFVGIAERRRVAIEFVEAVDWHLGNGASALSAKGRTGDSPFFLSMVDHLIDPEIGRILARHPPSPGEVCLAVDRDTANVFDLGDVTRVKLDGDRIEHIAKNLDGWNAADTGVFLCTNVLFGGLEQAASKGLHGLSDGVRELARDGRAMAVDVTGRPWLDLDTPAALCEAERRLSAGASGKARDGPVSRLINRPISRWLTRYLVRAPVTPNQVSFASWVLSCLAAVLFALGGYAALAAGGIVAQFASIIDGCDGEIARLKRLESEFGGWFDAVLDRYADAFLLFGLMWHAYSASPQPEILVVGFAAIVGSFANSYTADKYDGLMAKRLGGSHRFRLGRDVRVFTVFVGALLNLPFLTLGLVAAVMNAEVIRRIVLLRRYGSD